MAPHIKQLQAQAEEARAAYRAGHMTREDCNKLVKPYAEAYNTRAKELAKEYGMRFKPFSMAAYLR